MQSTMIAYKSCVTLSARKPGISSLPQQFGTHCFTFETNLSPPLYLNCTVLPTHPHFSAISLSRISFRQEAAVNKHRIFINASPTRVKNTDWFQLTTVFSFSSEEPRVMVCMWTIYQKIWLHLILYQKDNVCCILWGFEKSFTTTERHFVIIIFKNPQSSPVHYVRFFRHICYATHSAVTVHSDTHVSPTQ